MNYSAEERGSGRAVEMLVKKLKGKAFETNLPIPKFDWIEPAAPIEGIKRARVTAVTSGGVVPAGDPDHIESSNTTKWGKYDMIRMDRLSPDDFTSIHDGYDHQLVIADPNVVVPLDVLRELKRGGEFGGLINYFCATTDTGTATASATKFGTKVGKIFIGEHVNGVILASAWGACTRCDATIVKSIKEYGLPVVRMATIIPISLTIGVNRITPGIGTPYPLDDPPQGETDGYKLRLSMVRRALKALEALVGGQTVFEK